MQIYSILFHSWSINISFTVNIIDNDEYSYMIHEYQRFVIFNYPIVSSIDVSNFYFLQVHYIILIKPIVPFHYNFPSVWR